MRRLCSSDVPCLLTIRTIPGEAEELADLLADNRIAELAEMDEAKLKELFVDLTDMDLSAELAGYTDDVVGALMDAVGDEIEIEPEVPFSEVLREEHNYIVLYFDNEVDWLQAESLFSLQTVQSLSTRTDGKMTPGQERKGVGRVLRGAEALEAIRRAH